ncbi:MAG: hypothetical protein IPP32_09095 [Bacteroidetes bacterium]|nr:hypothetical protein [Bacteroidota bacterium]
MKNLIYCFLFSITLCSSCIVQSPKYTSLDKVMELQLGMSKDEVEKTLGLQPYDLKSVSDTATVFIYVYRVTDRKTLSIDTQPVNGRSALGKYIQLAVSYSKENKVIHVESCTLCPDNLSNTKKLDVQKLIVFLTITLPVILVFIGLN